MIRVVVADDHEVVRHGLRLVLEGAGDITVVGQAATGPEAIERTGALRPDLLLLDLRLPGLDGLEVLRRLRRTANPPRVLVLTAVDTRHDVLEAVAAGADGYALKQISPAQLVEAVRAVAGGQSYLHPGVTAEVLSAARARGPGTPASGWNLTRRELAVLALMATGRSNAEIAGKLFIGPETVRTHIKTILRKMGKHHRVEAVVAAAAAGLVEMRPQGGGEGAVTQEDG